MDLYYKLLHILVYGGGGVGRALGEMWQCTSKAINIIPLSIIQDLEISLKEIIWNKGQGFMSNKMAYSQSCSAHSYLK